jgi:mannose-6-phosphate isomerase-like protein (cupin superfamily)
MREPLLRRAELGTTQAYMGSLLSWLINAEETDGSFSLLIAHARRGSEPPPHVHTREDEVFFLLEGEIAFAVEGASALLEARAGDCVLLPCGRAHGLRIRSEQMRALSLLCAVEGRQVGAEAYLKAMAIGPADSMTLPDDGERYPTLSPEQLEAATRLAAEHGLQFLSPEEASSRLPLLSAAD